MKYDFSGWATRANLKCSDGRIIDSDAFKDNDGVYVPLVWNHQHNDAENVLGRAYLKHFDEGMRAYGIFNNTERGLAAKELVNHGDIVSLSIFANKLKQEGSVVKHGMIREVSLVLAGANPGAYIDEVMAHEEGSDENGMTIFTGEEGLDLEHTDIEETETVEENQNDQTEESVEHSDSIADDISGIFSKLSDEDKEFFRNMIESFTSVDNTTEASNGDIEQNVVEHADDESLQDIFDSLSEKQKTLFYYMISEALNNKIDSEEDNMKHNVFEGKNVENTDVLQHSDMVNIIADAKKRGSLKEAVMDALGNDAQLVHADNDHGIEYATGESTYGFNDPEMLFPDYKNVTTQPAWISRNMDWVAKVFNAIHHVPFTRIKSMYANITEDEARARGYVKGNQKVSEVFTTLKRSTDPQTIYKLQKMDRDDVIDITDFDVIAWIKAEMRVMLNEEIARAILIGDGRDSASDDKISEDHVRPVVSDADLFTIKYDISEDGTVPVSTGAEKAYAMIRGAIKARKNYKGSGNPTLFTTEDALTEMLLLEDQIGHRLYPTLDALATALRVKEIVTVEPMEDLEDADGQAILGIIVNLADYYVGADKGGQVSLFDDFDINFNRFEYLIETRISGALVKPYSAIDLYIAGE